MKNYWLHRVLNHEKKYSKELLDNGYLSIGYSHFMSEIEMKYDNVEDFHNIIEEYDNFGSNNENFIYKELNSDSRIRNYLSFKDGDYVVVTDYDSFSIFEIDGKVLYPKNLKEQISWNPGFSIENNKLKDENGRDIDLGLFYKIKAIKKNLSRYENVDGKLAKKLRYPRTNLKISDIKDVLEDVVKGRKASVVANNRKGYELNSRSVSILDLINSYELPIRIPVYQRPYSWGEPQIKRLLKDIRDAYMNIDKNDGDLFLGTILTQNNDGNKINVIDGQQRLTTLILIILALVEEHGNSFMDGIIKEIDIKRGVKSLTSFIKSDIFDEFENKSESDGNKYCENYEIIKKIISEEGFIVNKSDEDCKKNLIQELLDVILNKVFFIEISTRKESISDVVKIFDSINTTGMDLALSDIFKIRYFYYRKKISKDEISDKEIFDEINMLYKEMDKSEVNLNKDDFMRIYKDYLIGKYELDHSLHLYSNNRFFEELFDFIDGKYEENNKFWGNKVSEKDKMISKYEIKKIIEGYKTWNNVFYNEKYPRRTFLSDLLWSGSRYSNWWTIYPIILMDIEEINESFNNEKLETDDIEASERWKLIMSMMKLGFVSSIIYDKRTNSTMNMYYKALTGLFSKHEITNDKNKYDEIINENNKYVNKELKGELCESLKRNADDNYKRNTLLLSLYTYIMHKDNNKFFKAYNGSKKKNREKDSVTFDIEHIVPKNYENSEELISKYGENIIHKLGNMTFLDSKTNRSIKDSIYKKKEEYKKIHENYGIFDESSIDDINRIIDDCIGRNYKSLVETINNRTDIMNKRILEFLGVEK